MSEAGTSTSSYAVMSSSLVAVAPLFTCAGGAQKNNTATTHQYTVFCVFVRLAIGLDTLLENLP